MLRHTYVFICSLYVHNFFLMQTDQNYSQINDQHHHIMHKLCFLEEKFKKIFGRYLPPKLHKCRYTY